MDWWELSIITLSGNSCQLRRRTHNAVRACRLSLHQAPSTGPNLLHSGMAPLMDPPLFSALYRRLKWCWKCTVMLQQSGSSRVPVAPPVSPQHRLKKSSSLCMNESPAERVPKWANDSVAVGVGEARERACTSTHSEWLTLTSESLWNQWVTQ